MLLPDQSESSEAGEETAPTTDFHSFVLLFIAAKLRLNLIRHNSMFSSIDRLFKGSSPSLSRLLAGRKLPDEGHIGQGSVMSIRRTQERSFTLHNTPACSCTHHGGIHSLANQDKYSGLNILSRLATIRHAPLNQKRAQPFLISTNFLPPVHFSHNYGFFV